MSTRGRRWSKEEPVTGNKSRDWLKRKKPHDGGGLAQVVAVDQKRLKILAPAVWLAGSLAWTVSDTVYCLNAQCFKTLTLALQVVRRK